MDKKFEVILKLVQRNSICEVKTNIKDLLALNKYDNSFSINKIYRKSTGDGLLHIAARFGHLEILRYLLEEQCNIEQGNLDGKTALHDAAQFSHLECVKCLLEKGANVNAVKKADWTSIMLACTKQNLEIVEILLKYEANSKFCNKDGWNSFHIACREGNILIVEILWQCEPSLATSVSRNGRRPIHTAVMHGHVDIVLFILSKHPSEVNAKDNCGTTPIMDACRFGFISILDILVDNKADLTVSNRGGLTCLHVAAEAGQVDVIQCLVQKYSFDLHSLSSNQMTPLHYTVKEDNLEAMKCLLNLGARTDLPDERGRLCMDLAFNLKKVRILTQLIRNKPIKCYTKGSQRRNSI